MNKIAEAPKTHKGFTCQTYQVDQSVFDIEYIGDEGYYRISTAEGYLEVYRNEMMDLPATLRRKFETQKRISFRVLLTAINIWIRKYAESKKGKKEKP